MQVIQHFALRFGDSHSAARYPLPVFGPVTFVAREDECVARIHLPALPAEWILTASFITPGALTPSHVFRLLSGTAAWSLLPVPSQAGERPDQQGVDPSVSVHIDCWHTHASLAAPVLELSVAAPAAPGRYLICLSARPLTMLPGEPPALPRPLRARTPQHISQMTAAEGIRRHICSPTSVAMLMPGATRDVLAAACRDAATGLFGSWPMAVRAAAAGNAIAGVELHADWSQAMCVLRRGEPFAASIRYSAAQLRGAPLDSTGGHLVVVHGIDGDRVLIHDPAAADDATVAREYDATEFSRAWLAMRGASYIIVP